MAAQVARILSSKRLEGEVSRPVGHRRFACVLGEEAGEMPGHAKVQYVANRCDRNVALHQKLKRCFHPHGVDQQLRRKAKMDTEPAIKVAPGEPISFRQMSDNYFSVALLNAVGGVYHPLVPLILRDDWSEQRDGRAHRAYRVDKCGDERPHLLSCVQAYICQRQAELRQDLLERVRHRKGAPLAGEIVVSRPACMKPCM